jgi:thiol-disulfide isomerase/thioredoxin
MERSARTPGRVVAGAVALLLVLAAASPLFAEEEPDVIVFWADGCPFCEAELAFLGDLAAEYPDVVIATYEVRRDGANRDLFAATMATRGTAPTGVPTTIIGDRVWVGFDATLEDAIRAAVADLAAGETTDAGSTTIGVPLDACRDRAPRSSYRPADAANAGAGSNSSTRAMCISWTSATSNRATLSWSLPATTGSSCTTGRRGRWVASACSSRLGSTGPSTS